MGAFLRLADLTNADLTDADLTDADLTDADLTDADLTDADLTDANLEDVRGLTQPQLDAACGSTEPRNLAGELIWRSSQCAE